MVLPQKNSHINNNINMAIVLSCFFMKAKINCKKFNNPVKACAVTLITCNGTTYTYFNLTLQPARVITLYPFFVFARLYGVYPFGVS